ncbi:hypothetical protein ARMGADRAFT_1069320 [Armillaria gallica]|uniref:Uncharacterized protein n=1 Tax=Armillaria gallica TaxID=47427 RepID=A0A2H3CKP8_ARMGA|nr:hypothetical protein ARMGADRAFT_1069320 [Armillaria gallica]
MVKKGRGRGELGNMRRWDWEDGGICVGYGSSIPQATIRSINALSINFCQCTDIVIWQASPGQITGDSGTCSRERPISFPLINTTSSQTQAPSTTLQVPIMLPKTDEVFLTWAAVFPQTSKGPANMDCWEWEKFVFYLVLESSGISSYVTGIMHGEQRSNIEGHHDNAELQEQLTGSLVDLNSNLFDMSFPSLSKNEKGNAMNRVILIGLSPSITLASPNNPNPKKALAAVAKLACQPGAAQHRRNYEHHRPSSSMLLRPYHAQRRRTRQGGICGGAEERDSKDPARSMKQGIIGLAARSDGVLEFQCYMKKTERSRPVLGMTSCREESFEVFFWRIFHHCSLATSAGRRRRSRGSKLSKWRLTEIDALQEKLSISTKRVANHEANIVEHAGKNRRTTDHREKRRVSVRTKKNRRQAVLVPPSSAEVLQLSEEVASLQDDIKL